jgi:hypothetical protein
MSRVIEPLEPRTLLSDASPLVARTVGATITGTATDHAGSIYTTGMFSGRVDFDPDPNTDWILRAFNPNVSPPTSQYVAKYTEHGALVWALPLVTDGTGADPARTAGAGDIAVDSAGDIYVSGHFNGTVDFDPAKGSSFPLTTSTGDGFVLKLDGSSSYVSNWAWVRAIPNANPSANLATATHLAFGANTDLFVAGEQADADFTPYLARLDRFAGTVAYVHTLTTDDPELRTVAGLAAGPDGKPILVGDRRVPGGFVAKFDRDAAPLWNLNLPDAGGGLTAIAVNNKGHAFVTGQIDAIDGEVDLDPGGPAVPVRSAGLRDAYVARLNADGLFVWGRRLGGAGDDTVSSVTLDNDLNLHLTGTFTGQADFDPRRTQFLLDAGRTEDVYVAKWTPTGNFLDAFQIGAKKTRQTALPTVVATPTDRILLSGGFAGLIDFDPTEQALFLDSQAGGAFLVTYPT